MFVTMRALPFYLLLLLPTLLRAQPAEVSRVLHDFDFEERRAGNMEDTPMHWLKVEGEGLPHYTSAKLSTEAARGGQYGFRFELNGGSLLYRYPAGRIKAEAGGHYRVETFVRTTPLKFARARLTAYFTDIDGRTIKGSLHQTPGFVSPAGDKAWQPLSIDMTAEDSRTASIVLELALLQPSMFAGDTAEATTFEQDITGRAWFDDLTVARVPALTLSCDKPANAFARGEPTRLLVTVNDRITEDLTSRVVVRDADGKEVYQQTGGLTLAARQGAPDGDKVGVLLLPAELPAGWYRATLEMRSNGTFVGQQALAFVRLADAGQPAVPDPRFGLTATYLESEGWDALPGVLPLLGAGRVKLAVWTQSSDAEFDAPEKFIRLLEALRALRVAPTACLVDPPPRVAAKAGGPGWERLLRADSSVWQPALADLIARFSGYLDRWQVGTDDDAERFVTDPLMRSAYVAVLKQFSTLVHTPDLTLPWPAWYELESPASVGPVAGEKELAGVPAALNPATVLLVVPADILPQQVPLYVKDLRQTPSRNPGVSFRLLSRERYGRGERVNDLAKRIAYALSAGVDRIDLPLPFTIERRNGVLVSEPEELFIVERTLFTTLGHATYKGRVPIDDDVEAFLFDRDGVGVLMLWNRAADGKPRRVELTLGTRPVKLDLWGNASDVIQPANAAGALVLDVGQTPFFLVGVDGHLAQLRASFGIDQPLIESTLKVHLRHLKFTNPYAIPISGSIRLSGPKGWSVSLQNPTFDLAPGETYDGSVSIEFPYNSFAGGKTLMADFQLQADAMYRLKLPIKLVLGLGDVGLETIALRDGKDVIVQQMITNYGTQPINYTSFVVFPGQARQERLVTALKPGGTSIKKFRFTGAATPGVETTVRSGLKETEGTRVLNQEAVVQ